MKGGYISILVQNKFYNDDGYEKNQTLEWVTFCNAEKNTCAHRFAQLLNVQLIKLRTYFVQLLKIMRRYDLASFPYIQTSTSLPIYVITVVVQSYK